MTRNLPGLFCRDDLRGFDGVARDWRDDERPCESTQEYLPDEGWEDGTLARPYVQHEETHVDRDVYVDYDQTNVHVHVDSDRYEGADTGQFDGVLLTHDEGNPASSEAATGPIKPPPPGPPSPPSGADGGKSGDRPGGSDGPNSSWVERHRFAVGVLLGIVIGLGGGLLWHTYAASGDSPQDPDFGELPSLSAPATTSAPEASETAGSSSTSASTSTTEERTSEVPTTSTTMSLAPDTTDAPPPPVQQNPEPSKQPCTTTQDPAPQPPPDPAPTSEPAPAEPSQPESTQPAPTSTSDNPWWPW